MLNVWVSVLAPWRVKSRPQCLAVVVSETDSKDVSYPVVHLGPWNGMRIFAKVLG